MHKAKCRLSYSFYAGGKDFSTLIQPYSRCEAQMLPRIRLAVSLLADKRYEYDLVGLGQI